jgi:hypothetical protein
LSREHARAMYPGLFATPAVAWRAIEAARRLIETTSAKVHNPAEQPEIPISIDLGISVRTRGLCTFACLSFRPWQFRLAGKAAKRLATVLVAEGFEEQTRSALAQQLGEIAVWRPEPVRPVSPASIEADTVFHPVGPSIDTSSVPPPVLHPPLPGEDLQPHRPPPAQAGLLGVIPGQRAVPVDPYPEPGSFEPDEGMPDEAPEVWKAELRRRLDALPPVDTRADPTTIHFRGERRAALVAAIEAEWAIDWREAWMAGRRTPLADERAAV